MDLKMKVNHLPALTYRFLKSNDSEIDLKDINIEDTATPDPQDVPAGVTVEKNVSEADVAKLFEKFKKVRD